MVILARYLRDLPPNEGGLMTNNNEPIGCGRRNTTLIVFNEQHFIQSSIQSKTIQSTSFQVIYTRATLICIVLST